MIVDASAHADRGGGRQVSLEVAANNEAAQALYRRFGFAPVGVRELLPVTGQDALVMWVYEVDSPGVRGSSRGTGRHRAPVEGSRTSSEPCPGDTRRVGASPLRGTTPKEHIH